ncbi:hypothetical protein [Nesterenkonia rhizosphaerae]|uniref:Uncharacterized protein n=1 Tax=Nesterenkonia rhizosphaerae TaxID=1348272 RepID=A0ABP9G0E8_9MICC
MSTVEIVEQAGLWNYVWMALLIQSLAVVAGFILGWGINRTVHQVHKAGK